jgi:hypothetical protein
VIAATPPEALITDTLILVQDHAAVLHDAAPRLAQIHDLERVAALRGAATDPGTGTVRLRPARGRSLIAWAAWCARPTTGRAWSGRAHGCGSGRKP